MLTRSLSRSLSRSTTRYTTRMLNGARRRSEPDYLAIACRALEEVMRIDRGLRPFMEEQKRQLEARLFRQEIDAALRRVYGPLEPGASGQTAGGTVAPQATRP